MKLVRYMSTLFIYGRGCLWVRSLVGARTVCSGYPHKVVSMSESAA